MKDLEDSTTGHDKVEEMREFYEKQLKELHAEKTSLILDKAEKERKILAVCQDMTERAD